MTVVVPATSDVCRVCTLKSWLALFQTTLGFVLLQVLAPQVGGLDVAEMVSPKAGIVVDTYD